MAGWRSWDPLIDNFQRTHCAEHRASRTTTHAMRAEARWRIFIFYFFDIFRFCFIFKIVFIYYFLYYYYDVFQLLFEQSENTQKIKTNSKTFFKQKHSTYFSKTRFSMLGSKIEKNVSFVYFKALKFVFDSTHDQKTQFFISKKHIFQLWKSKDQKQQKKTIV